MMVIDIDIDTMNVLIGATPLLYAAEQGHYDACALLLDMGANIHSTCKEEGYYKFNALHLAAEQGHTNVCELLLDRGMDVNATVSDKYPITALDWAVSNDRLDVAKLLLKRGADPNLRSEYSLLYSAIEYGSSTEICKLLIDNGINIEDYTADGTPLYMALHQNRDDVAKMLIAKGANTDLSQIAYRVETGMVLGLIDILTDMVRNR